MASAQGLCLISNNSFWGNRWMVWPNCDCKYNRKLLIGLGPVIFKKENLFLKKEWSEKKTRCSGCLTISKVASLPQNISTPQINNEYSHRLCRLEPNVPLPDVIIQTKFRTESRATRAENYEIRLRIRWRIVQVELVVCIVEWEKEWLF